MVGSNGHNNSNGGCLNERRRNLMQEFQGLLNCIESKKTQETMVCYPCSDQPQLMCLPVCQSTSLESNNGNSRKELAKEKLKAALEKLPQITSVATEEIRPSSDIRNVEDDNSAHIKYMDIDDFAEWKKNKMAAGSDDCAPQRMCCVPMSCPSPAQCSPVFKLSSCPYLSQSQTASQTAPQMMLPCPRQQYICVPCPQPNKNAKAIKERTPLPWDDRELRGGVLYTGCECSKRNGLQHDCPRTLCQGRPACLVKPEPDCIPSGGTGLMRPPPRISNYPYVEPDCEPPQPRDRGYPGPDPCHRAAVDCDKCVPVLMCRPECPPAAKPSRIRYCPVAQVSQSQPCHAAGRPSQGKNLRVRMCPEFAAPKAQQMCMQPVAVQDSACPAFMSMYQMQPCPSPMAQGQMQAAQQPQQAQQQDPQYVCFSQCP